MQLAWWSVTEKSWKMFWGLRSIYKTTMCWVCTHGWILLRTLFLGSYWAPNSSSLSLAFRPVDLCHWNICCLYVYILKGDMNFSGHFKSFIECLYVLEKIALSLCERVGLFFLIAELKVWFFDKWNLSNTILRLLPSEKRRGLCIK